jgi:hypothetical protein
MLYPCAFVPQHLGSVKRFSTLFHRICKLALRTGMARKNKRQQPRKPQRGRPYSGPARPATPAPPARGAAEAAAPGPTPRPGRPLARGGAAPAASQSAAIPLERVPYFQSDLRRIAITGAAMVVILVVGSLLIH